MFPWEESFDMTMENATVVDSMIKSQPEDEARNLIFWSNLTDPDDDFASSYVAASDVSVDAVVTSLYLNAFAFVIIMATYEVLRRLLPAVYSSRKKHEYKSGGARMGDSEATPNDSTSRIRRMSSFGSVDSRLPDVISFYWMSSVFNVSWSTVRKYSGLDGYFFLRFIRMNLRICAVTCFWAMAVLAPIYGSGANQNGQEGWYHISVANVVSGGWRMWAPAVFAYLFAGFIFFVMKQEYRHFLELRMDFLARGSSHVHPQHHYSLIVENIPHDLRSEKALRDYFEKLFPGKIHSANVLLNLPDLEAVKTKCLRVCRRLEKSIAHYHASGTRPTHNVGSPRIRILGIDLSPFDWSCGAHPDVAYVDNRLENQKPVKGTHVDSISYYTHDLAECNKVMYNMQQRKTEIALTGNFDNKADSWLARLVLSAYEAADQIMIESAEDNALGATSIDFDRPGSPIPQAELMSSRYGSFSPEPDLSPKSPQSRRFLKTMERVECPIKGGLQSRDEAFASGNSLLAPKTPSQEKLLVSPPCLQDEAPSKHQKRLDTPGKTSHTNWFRRLAGRLGLDFAVAVFKFMNRQLDQTMEGVVGATMSSTGFVTFLDLTSVTCAASAPLTNKPQKLDVSVAPEPRDIIWANAHVSEMTRSRNERIVNIFLFIGGFFWIFPLTAIQAFAKADYIARIPGMEWILTSGGGSVSQFVNGYLPVVALLCLILILPVIFELVAKRYERRKTFSDVQRSMMGRYFYYQVINIYITVTAGSLWSSLSDILDHPTNLLELLGESLPSMVGYFIALLVTKILAGLPIVFLRVGALSRMILLRSLSSGKRLTQRELDEVYRPENVQYGWEFPAQLLVIMIVFTYAVICPVILPVGLCYYCFSLMVYKKQVLYVYQPVYESGGALFPFALQNTLFGLVCGQLTLIGYLITRGCYFQPIFLLPLPIVTIWGMSYFDQHYAKPATSLSLERAREYDRISELLAAHQASVSSVGCLEAADELVVYGVEARRNQFDKNSYRQPVLTQKAMVPMAYRKGQVDQLTDEAIAKLQEVRDYSLMTDSSIGST